MIVGRIVMFPIPGQPNPPTEPATNATSNITTEDIFCSYDWCHEIPRIEITQFMIGFVVATAGYPFCLTLSGSIYSKVLGSSNQVI